MKRIYYQSQAARVVAGSILILFGLSPWMIAFYINVIKDDQSFRKFFSSFFKIFNNDLFFGFCFLFLMALYFIPVFFGFLFIKNSKKIIKLEFRDNGIYFVKPPKMKSKGDVWVTGFGYRQQYTTLPYKVITSVELIKNIKWCMIVVKTGTQTQKLNISFTPNEAETIIEFITARMNKHISNRTMGE